MLLLLCIMSDTDSDLGNFSCHRQLCRFMTTVLYSANAKFAIMSACRVTRQRVYRLVAGLAKTKTLYSVSGLIDTALVC